MVFQTLTLIYNYMYMESSHWCMMAWEQGYFCAIFFALNKLWAKSLIVIVDVIVCYKNRGLYDLAMCCPIRINVHM